MGKGSIDLGLPTEDKPEWTISLDFVEKEKEREIEKTISQNTESVPAPETGVPEPSFSSQASSSALDSEFLLDGDISPAGSQDAGGTGGLSGALDGNISSAGDAVLGGGAEMLNTGGISGALDGGISSASDAVLGGGDMGISDESDTMIQMPHEQEDSFATLGEDTIMDSPGLSDVKLDVPVQAPKEEMINQAETGPEPVEQPVQSVQPAVPDDLEKEKDEVEERLNHLANSMDDWEQSEKALSEAAAMLSAERNEETELKNLFDRLDISENLDRMNATVREDLADVIEQTDQDELLEAKSVISGEEKTISPDIEISNDMFDLGVDLSDDNDFSDENIDLSSFKGSIEDADEFNKPSSNSIDLDDTEATTTNSLNSELDMSNLVAAALNDLSGNTEPHETVSPEPVIEPEPELEPTPQIEPEPELELTPQIEPEPEPELELTPQIEPEPELELTPQIEPVEEENSLTFDMGTEPETNEGSLEFITEDDPLESDIGTESGIPGGFEFAETDEPESPTEINEEESIPEFTVAPETEEMKLKFEPVYPEGDAPTISSVIDDIAGDDITSMIIEDYSEVPTVSDIENKLNKQEKEKKRGRSKESHQNKEDGFAYSLDDISAGEEMPHNPVVEAALEVAADALAKQETAATGEPKPEPVERKRRVSTQHIVHKDGKIKRSYYKIFYV